MLFEVPGAILEDLFFSLCFVGNGAIENHVQITDLIAGS